MPRPGPVATHVLESAPRRCARWAAPRDVILGNVRHLALHEVLLRLALLPALRRCAIRMHWLRCVARRDGVTHASLLAAAAHASQNPGVKSTPLEGLR